MSVLFQINMAANRGSHGRIAEGIGEIVQAKGWKSYIAYGRYANPSQSHLLKIGTTSDVYLHGAQSLLLDRHGLGSLGATKRLIQEIESIQPDVIHLHNIHGYYLNYPVLFDFLSKADIPVVWTLHDAWALTGHCAFFDAVHCEKWKTKCGQCPKKGDYPKSILLDRSERNYELKRRCFTSLKKLVLVPVSDWLAGILGESFLRDIPRVRIHNGIDTDSFRPNDMLASLFPGKKVVLGVNNVWEPRKGLTDFMTLRTLLDDQFVIVLIGLSKRQKAHLPEGIVGIERTDHIQELAGYYSRADVFVNPTYEDNYPTTHLEAQACGTFVITYQTGGCAEAIDEKTGLTVPTGDVKALADSIRTFCLGSDKGQVAEACRRRAELYYRKEDRFQEYYDLYASLIGNQSVHSIASESQ